jgi:hypothetical protein
MSDVLTRLWQRSSEFEVERHDYGTVLGQVDALCQYTFHQGLPRRLQTGFPR